MSKIPVYKPYLPSHSLRYAHEALDSGWLSKGKYNELVTEKLKELLNVKHIILTSSGTTATHLAAKGLKYKCGSKKIMMPSNIYVAAMNSFLFDKEYSMIPLPADLNTWNWDERYLDPDENTALCVVHNVGSIVNVPRLQKQFPNTPIVEDACEGFLGTYDGKPVGSASLVSSISFFGNKNITCGEGGAVATNDDEIFEYLDCLKGQGLTKAGSFVHKYLGYNYRLTNIQAAILYGQLEILDEVRAKKVTVFDQYKQELEGKVVFQQTDPDTTPSQWMFGIRIPGSQYKRAKQFLAEHEIETRPMFCDVRHHDHINIHPRLGDITVADQLRQECVVLPSYPELTESQTNYITQTVKDYIKTL